MERAEMLNRLRAERAALLAALEGATVADLHHAPAGRWSVAGILLHLMDLEADVVAGVAALNRGDTPEWFSVSDWDARNVIRAKRWPERPSGDLRATLAAQRQALEDCLAGLTDAHWADHRYRTGFSVAAVHDFEHLPGVQERLALARGDQRTAAVQYAAITRHELLALLERVPVEAYGERLPDKWSIKEILIHLAIWDRMWTEIVGRESAGGTDEWPLTEAELAAWNEREVAKLKHLPAARVPYLLGEARGEWSKAMLRAPDWLVAEPRYLDWAGRRFRHDRHHLGQIQERYRNWRQRQGK